MIYLEDYLDNSDFIRIYEMQSFGSLIEADYFIEASIQSKNSTVYIFIRKRIENEHYVIVSFFRKHNVYVGTNAYWMKKTKSVSGKEIVLYKNPNYNDKNQNIQGLYQK